MKWLHFYKVHCFLVNSLIINSSNLILPIINNYYKYYIQTLVSFRFLCTSIRISIIHTTFPIYFQSYENCKTLLDLTFWQLCNLLFNLLSLSSYRFIAEKYLKYDETATQEMNTTHSLIAMAIWHILSPHFLFLSKGRTKIAANYFLTRFQKSSLCLQKYDAFWILIFLL